MSRPVLSMPLPRRRSCGCSETSINGAGRPCCSSRTICCRLARWRKGWIFWTGDAWWSRALVRRFSATRKIRLRSSWSQRFQRYPTTAGAGLSTDALACFRPGLRDPASAKFVLVYGHCGLTVGIANDSALRDQFQGHLIFQSGGPIERNLQQLAHFKFLVAGEQDSLTADIQSLAGSLPRQNGVLESLIAYRQPAWKPRIVAPLSCLLLGFIRVCQSAHHRITQIRRV